MPAYEAPSIKTYIIKDALMDLVQGTIQDINEDDDDVEEPAKPALPSFDVWED